MKKRILSILLALCMLFCLVPTTAFAAGETNRKVETEQELVDALADSSVDIITLKNDIAIGTTLTILRKVTLDLNGYVLKMTGSGSVIILDNKSGITGDLTLIDSNPTAEHKFKVNGVEPWVLDDSGTETVYGGIITGGTGSRIFFSNGVEGGGVIIGSGALTMNGGNIVGCIANDGGGLFLSDGSFTMNAGSIVGCSTPNRLTTGEAFYGGIYAFGPMASGDTTGVITLTGGLIKNNGRYAINAVYKTTIYANGGEVYGGVDLNQACKITCLAEDNGITAFKGKTVIGGASGVNASHVDWGLFYGGLYIYGNTTGVIVTYKDGDSEYAKQVLPSGTLATRPDDPTKPGHIFDGWYTSDGAQCDYTTAVTENVTVTARWTLKTQSVSSEQELNDALADISVGKILLTADIDISSSLTVNRKVALDLNGYVLRYADTTANGSVFKIVSGGDLTVIDSRPDAEHRFNSDNILWAPDEQNGKEIVMGGVITGGMGTPCYVNGSSYFVACGGGVYLEGDARFTMDGGNIVGCIANTGGGVHISENGSFTMNGGSIMGCSSWDFSGPGGTPYFGGVYLDSGTFTMTGGVIKDCAKYSVVLNENATMNANGGEIYGVVEVGKNSYVTGLDGIAGVTVFRDNFWIYHNSARVDWGIFYGSITNYYDDPIIGLTVTYMNGETIYARQILPSGTLATRPDAPTTTPGYTFGGWNKVDGTAWNYASDKVNDNITLYAKWTANTYTITFDTAGGSEIAPITQDYGTHITAPADPTREGYTFIGWDREIPKTMPAENMTVTAQWEINRYTITFDTAGGSEIAPITQEYGTHITAPADLTREGYTFIGWDREIPTTMPAENMTVTAQWEIDRYTITFDTAGGSEIAPITQDYGTNITAPADPTREGYTFIGWDRKIPETMPAENMTVTAQWEINRYTITFYTAGGSKIAPITQDYGTNIAAPADPTREGYTFIGWDRKIPETMPAENMTVTAQWEIDRYTITFDTAGGSEIAPITQEYGTHITAPADPTREGYTFIGWDTEIPTTMPAENMTIKARWRDTEKPTGEIKINENSWKAFLNNITFGLFFKDTQTVTITAADNSGTVFISYLVTDRDLSETELGSLVYRAYEEPFCIDPNGEYIVYAMLVDESLNITYLRSDRVTLDNVQPVIGGIEDGKTYCEAQTVTVDEKYVNTLTVNGTEVTLDENNSFTLAPADGEQKIVVTDKAGNTAEMTVTVNNGHTFGEWVSNGDGTHTRKCTVDGCTGSETKDCSGGKATCKDKAVCEVCGKAYGELDPKNHTALKHISAKAATEDAEGNIEYWYCEDCDKYYSDKYGTKEIKKADTVTAKLPKSTPTGDTSNLMLWIALLLASGGAVIGTAVVSKKKKHSAE